MLQQLDAAAVALESSSSPASAAPAPAIAAAPADPEAARLASLPRNYETITDYEALARWCEALQSAQLFAFDTETTSLDYMNTEIVGLSFCITSGHAAYVPLAHDYPGAPPQLERARTRIGRNSAST